MNDKKKNLIIKGARVRVANSGYEGADRWNHALHGMVAGTGGSAVEVVLDGETLSRHILWQDVDVETKPRAQWLDLPLALIRPSRWQYRRRFDAESLMELAKSIQQSGLINRLLVFRHEDGDHFEIIAGERRLRALCALAMAGVAGNPSGATDLVAAPGWWQSAAALLPPIGNSPTVACELRDGQAADFREIAILENLQRQNPTPSEEAQAFLALLEEEGYTQVKLAQRLGKSQAYISQRLSLLDLVAEVRDVVDSQEISFSAARAIATLPDGIQPTIAAHICRQQKVQGDSQTTTRQVQAQVRQVRDFFDPERWNPPEYDEIWPDTRNRLRLLKHYIQSLTAEQMPRAFERLLVSKTVYGDNIIGKEVVTIARESYLTGRTIGFLIGKDVGYSDAADEDFWREIAPIYGWTCESCQFSTARRPSASKSLLCHRWRDLEEDTCIQYIGLGDPILLPFTTDRYQLARDLESLKIALPQIGSWMYTTDFEQYASIQEQLATKEKVEESGQEQSGRMRNRFIPMSDAKRDFDPFGRYCPRPLMVAYLTDHFGQVIEGRCCLTDQWGNIITLYELLEILAEVKPYYDETPDREIEQYNEGQCRRELEGGKARSNNKEDIQPQIYPGFVYLIQAGGYYKIGVTKNINKRFKKLTALPPFDLELVCVIESPDIYKLERALHETFNHRHVKGEWFKLDTADIAYIKGLALGI